MILDYSWKEIELLPKEKTYLFMTVAPIEEHSHHLPVGVDIQLGEYWKEKTIEKLEKKYPNYNFISMPFLPLAAGSMKTFPGCVYIRPKKLRKLIFKILKNISEWGIQNFVIIASHGDPFHNMAIEKACDLINNRSGTRFISPMGTLFSSEELNIDLKPGNEVDEMIRKYPEDFHAGWIETSMMMDISPDKVSDKYKVMKDIIVTEKEMIQPKKYIQKTRGQGHLGYPKHSRLSLGRDLNNSTINFIGNIVEKMIKKEDIEKYKHHFLFKLPFLRVLV